MKKKTTIAALSVLFYSLPTSAGIIDLNKLRSPETQKSINDRVKAHEEAQKNKPTENTINRTCSGGDYNKVDFSIDFKRTREKLQKAEQVSNPRYSDEFSKKRADDFFGTPNSPNTEKTKLNSETHIFNEIEKQWLTKQSLPQAVAATMASNPNKYFAIRDWLSDLRLNYDPSTAIKKMTMEPDASGKMVMTQPVSTLISDDPVKVCAIKSALMLAKEVDEKQSREAIQKSYKSSTTEQNRATPAEIEERFLPRK